MQSQSPRALIQRYHQITNVPFAETPVLVAELEQVAEKEAEMSDCSIEGEDQC